MEESMVANEFIAIGRDRGRAEGVKALVLEIGRKRFGCDPSAAQRTALDAITNPDLLAQLEDRILDAGSWDELLPPG